MQDTGPEKQLSFFLYIDQQAKKKRKKKKHHKTKPVLQASAHIKEALEKVQPFYVISRVQIFLMYF